MRQTSFLIQFHKKITGTYIQCVSKKCKPQIGSFLLKSYNLYDFEIYLLPRMTEQQAFQKLLSKSTCTKFRLKQQVWLKLIMH